MKKLLGAIFGSDKHTDAVISGLDKVWFTNEEKSDFFLKYLAATQPQNLARRLIAVAVVVLWSLLILVATFSWLWSQDYATFVFNVIDTNVNMPFGIIIGFYFAAHIVRQMPGKK